MRDPDIENFLKNKAVEFECLSKARTYLVCDESSLISNGELRILGYISLALKVLHVPNGFSVRQRKELDGYRGKIKSELITDIPCYLIGQLARNDDTDRSRLTGCDLIEDAQRIIMESVKSVGGRFMMIECRKNEQLIQFYRDNGFVEISHESDGDLPMVQMLCKIVN